MKVFPDASPSLAKEIGSVMGFAEYAAVIGVIIVAGAFMWLMRKKYDK